MLGPVHFLPVTVDNIFEHKMHSEWGQIDVQTAAAINVARANGRRIIAVGTTSLRILEACYQKNDSIKCPLLARRIYSSRPVMVHHGWAINQFSPS